MKQLWIIFIVIYTHTTYSQSNVLFSANNTKWQQTLGFWTPTIVGGPINYHVGYNNILIKGDSMINNMVFQKLYKGSYVTIFDTTCVNFFKYILNDSNKIYVGTKPDSMILIYNYNLIKGDSFAIKGSTNIGGVLKTYYPKVDSISTILYAGKWRKRIQFTALPYNTKIVWVEGVGDVKYGLTESYESIMLYNSFGTSLSSMYCFYDGSTHLSLGSCSFRSCNISTTIFDDLSPEELKLYPNPANTIINTNIQSDDFVELNYQVFNITGKIVKEGILSNDKNIYISDLDNGMYFVKIKNDRYLYKGLFIKN